MIKVHFHYSTVSMHIPFGTLLSFQCLVKFASLSLSSVGYFTHVLQQLCSAALACSQFRLLVMSQRRACIDFYPNNGNITPCYHIFLSLSLYWYFNIAISLRVSGLTWRGSLFSSPYCSSGAENMFLPLRIVC